ncbi:MAG: putative beta-lysine N-acetyltransferase [Bacillaceae bacterium]|nr:putative beta-lysine N-acetyltransferase [Bacillaceae bacterium]
MEEQPLTDRHLIIDRPNRRIKLMDSKRPDLKDLLAQLPVMAQREQAGKIIVYARKKDVELVRSFGYREEGRIDGFFNGKNAYLLSSFPENKRGIPVEPEEEDRILELAQSKDPLERKVLPEGLTLRQACPDDADELVQVFRTVFPVYPTPVHEPAYLKKMMQNHVAFMLIEKEGRIISVASAEITPENGCAELTDCATLPEFRGQSLLSYLFFALEDHLEQQGIYYLFSLTRAISPGMNITTARHGYRYRGRLIQNCVISTGFEDMNIWVKPLRQVDD